jgi:hypothetical protein
VTNEELDRAVGKILGLSFKEGDPFSGNGAPFLPSSNADDAVRAAMEEELFEGDRTLCQHNGQWQVYEQCESVLMAEDSQFGRAICKAIIKLHEGEG